MKIGKFKVLGELGKGAHSTILKICRDADLATYALKVVHVDEPDDKKFVIQGENEFKIASSIDHPAIIKVFAFEKLHSLFRLTGARLLMEFVDGLPLSRCEDLPMVKLLSIFFKVSEGMCALHKAGIFHADLKPDNVMVLPTRDVKIIDLGLAWREGDRKERVQGTLEFLAPEQARDRIVNAKTDIFNFGAMMYRIWTKTPVPSQLRDASAGRVGDVDLFTRPISEYRSDFPNELDELVRQCVRFRAKDRPATMRDVRDELKRIGKAVKQSLR